MVGQPTAHVALPHRRTEVNRPMARAKNPWQASASQGATHAVYEIRTVADFLKVPEARRRICLREFHSWLGIQADITALLVAASDASGGGLKPENFHWHTDVFRWNDDGEGCISVRMVELPKSADAVARSAGDSTDGPRAQDS